MAAIMALFAAAAIVGRPFAVGADAIAVVAAVIGLQLIVGVPVAAASMAVSTPVLVSSGGLVA